VDVESQPFCRHGLLPPTVKALAEWTAGVGPKAKLLTAPDFLSGAENQIGNGSTRLGRHEVKALDPPDRGEVVETDSCH
jgi:hypothetical protein